jgi:hypothetical protein
MAHVLRLAAVSTSSFIFCSSVTSHFIGNAELPKAGSNAFLPFGKKLPHLTGAVGENNILIENFLGGAKNNQLLNATAKDINLVFGQWDAIAIAEVKSLFELAKIIVSEVRGIQSVQDTITHVQGEL